MAPDPTSNLLEVRVGPAPILYFYFGLLFVITTCPPNKGISNSQQTFEYQSITG